jgi:hypothetical protein
VYINPVELNYPIAQSVTQTVAIGGIDDRILRAATDKLIAYLKAKYPDRDFKDLYCESFEHTLWQDGSLDCPKDGYYYDQVITPGYKIRFQVGNGWYDIHTNEDVENLRIVSPKIDLGFVKE